MGAQNSVQRSNWATLYQKSYRGAGVPQLAICAAVTASTFSIANYIQSRKKKIYGRTASVGASTTDPLLTRITAQINSLEPHQATLYSIIAINTAIFAASRTLAAPRLISQQLYKLFHYNPLDKLRYSGPSMLLSAFSHGSLIHLGFNMIALNAIGSIVHKDLGREKFLALYLSAACWGSLGHYTGCLLAKSAMGAIGASGAIYALAAYTAVTHPDIKLSLIFLPWFPFYAYHGMLGIATMDVIGLTGILRVLFGSNLAHSAHLAGGATGVIAAYNLLSPAQKKYTIFNPRVRHEFHKPINSLIGM